MKRLLIFFIRVYQKTLSVDHGPLKFLFPAGVCKFRPTCSEYGAKIIEKRGILVGCYKLSRRLLKCHPWTQGGIDEP